MKTTKHTPTPEALETMRKAMLRAELGQSCHQSLPIKDAVLAVSPNLKSEYGQIYDTVTREIIVRGNGISGWCLAADAILREHGIRPFDGKPLAKVQS